MPDMCTLEFDTLRLRKNNQYLADGIFKGFFLKQIFEFQIKFHSNFVPMLQIDDMSALVQVMVCDQIGNKSLPKSVMTKFTDTYMSLGLNVLKS